MKKLIVILIILALIIGSLPFLSSTIGKPFIVSLLESRFNGKMTVEKASFSWAGPQVFDEVTFTNPEMNGSLLHFESPVPFWKINEISRTFEIRRAAFTFPTYSAQIVNADVKIQDHSIQATAQTPQGGSLNVNGTFISKNDFDLIANLQQIPTIAIDKLLRFDNALPNILGPTVNFKGSFLLKHNLGTISSDLSTPLATAFLRASIANNILTLHEPFQATLHPLAKELTKYINPRFITELSIKNPVTITISPVDFRLPLKPFSLDQLQFSKAELNIGQAQIQSGESLHFLMSLFKNKDFGKQFDIWFTPITFSMKKSILQIDRADALLAGSVHLFTWGDIRLNKKTIHMTLGIPASTLRQSFEIETLLPNFVLKIPIRGSLSNPKFETGHAIAKIAAMATSKHIPSKGGKIFGHAVNAFAQIQDDQDIPPPKKPFPWEK